MNLKKPKFWAYKKLNFVAYLLYPVSLLVKSVNSLRVRSDRKKFKIKTVCIGNIYLGGTGKTSLSIKLNEILNKKNLKSCFVKKYYKNQLDEQKLLQSKGELFLSSKRIDAIKKAENRNFDIAILDDGLQDKSINYDLSIVKKGYQELSEKIELNISNLNYKKKYILAPAIVKVDFNLKPEKGKLFIDGNLYNDYSSLNLSTKKSYNFVYKKNGYLTKEKEFIFYENKVNTVKFLLEKEYGEVNIIASPIGKIKIDGKDYGNTPKKIKLQTIKQKLEISKEGFLKYETYIKPKSTELSKVEVKLEKEFDNIERLNPENYINSIGIKIKLFSPGRFTMGAPRHEKGQRANEFLKEIILRKKFYSSLTEVTIEQFMEFKGKSNTKRNKNLPISNIFWKDAISFCNWLSKKEGLDSVYVFNKEKYVGANLQNNGYRLPTEAEWEWLARKAGRNSVTKFSWGKNLPIPKMAGNLADESVIGFKELYIPNYKDNHRGLAPVGTFKNDISGLHDLTGNVKEWVHDYYLVSVPKSNMIYYDPSGPKKGVGHVVKGSSYLSATLQEVRASYRDSEVNKKDDIGFRIVRYLYGKEFKNNEK